MPATALAAFTCVSVKRIGSGLWRVETVCNIKTIKQNAHIWYRSIVASSCVRVNGMFSISLTGDEYPVPQDGTI